MLVASRDVKIGALVADVLRACKYQVQVVQGFQPATPDAASDLAIVDVPGGLQAGQTVLSAWRAMSDTQHLPIVLLLESDGQPILDRVGQLATVRKPFRISELLAAIRVLLGSGRAPASEV